MNHFNLEEVAHLQRLATLLIEARRDPATHRKADGRPLRAVTVDGRVVEVTVGPHGGITRRAIGRITRRAIGRIRS